ncbi:MAPK kinase substrate protein [Capsicum chacoense]
MAGLQRSATSFRRQGSSGLVWDDKLLTASGELVQLGNPRGGESATKSDRGEEEEKPKLKVSVPPSKTTGESMERSRSNRGFRTGKVSPAIEPPSPRVSACGFCRAFGKNDKTNRPVKSGKRKM